MDPTKIARLFLSAFALIFALIIAVVCNALMGGPDPSRPPAYVLDSVLVVGSQGAGDVTVQLVEMSDGTTCAVLIGYKKSGIDCNFQ